MSTGPWIYLLIICCMIVAIVLIGVTAYAVVEHARAKYGAERPLKPGETRTVYSSDE